ncbi:unnamed protein product [Echinostoma caproni]|uniref:Myosin_tail_1 domain-containing protein n=1 Tax=Echinostoma caproni TaxID=27848 RepID=A0A183AKQ8_9TREM|nr:unnamed protein product [Echinostoma caproni]
MFMKTSFFKHFKKDTDCMDQNEIRSAENIRLPPGRPLLWGGLDDSENSTSCDMDEDDYFGEETFDLAQAKEIETLKEEITKISQSLRNIKCENQKLETANKELKVSTNLSRSIKKIEHEFKLSKLNKLENQLATEKNKYLEYETSNEDLKKERNELLDQVASLKKSESKMKQGIDNLRLANEKLSGERDQFDKYLEKSKSDLRETEGKLAALKLEYEKSLQEISRLNSKAESCDAAIETGSLKIAQLNQVVSDLTMQLEYSRQELAAHKQKEKSLQEQIKKKECEKVEMTRDYELRQEKIAKMNAKSMENAIGEKEKEIKALRMELDSRRGENVNERKKLEKKANDAASQLEKLKEQIRGLTAEKIEVSEQQTKARDALLQRLEELEKVISEQQKKMKNNEMELEQLRKTEKEFKELQHQIYTNSPPASSQLPESIGISVTQTPKSPALSVRLHSMAIMKTPQKTPRSILRQPGSASKRRRVFFATQSDESMVESSLLLTPTKSDEDNDTSNIRKTPCKSGSKVTEIKKKKHTGKDSVNWFECDKFFGVGLED